MYEDFYFKTHHCRSVTGYELWIDIGYHKDKVFYHAKPIELKFDEVFGMANEPTFKIREKELDYYSFMKSMVHNLEMNGHLPKADSKLIQAKDDHIKSLEETIQRALITIENIEQRSDKKKKPFAIRV